MEFMGYLRPDGSVGIRNRLLIVSVDECCDGIARSIAKKFRRGCYSNKLVYMYAWWK